MKTDKREAVQNMENDIVTADSFKIQDLLHKEDWLTIWCAATVMFSNIKKFGLYGLGIAWFVTPIVIIFMWIFGTKVLKMRNKRMVITIAVATSVCGTVDKTDDKTVGAEEIWNRLPKFVLGFLAVSLIFSFVIQPVFGAEACADIQGCFKQLQTWCFALALYVIGQTFNLILTYFICWLLLSGVMFPIPTLLS